jgi:hypothetical protein
VDREIVELIAFEKNKNCKVLPLLGLNFGLEERFKYKIFIVPSDKQTTLF